MPSLRLKRARHMPGAAAIAAAVLLLTACSSTPASPVHSPSPFTGGMTEGLIAYVADQGVGVLDPTTGKSVIVAPLQPGTFRVAGPVWAPAPGVNHPVLYFTVHDVRPAETRTGAGVVPYDWLFRSDPFTGTIDPVAASVDSQSEGPLGLVANSHYLALTVGCCTTYEVDALDLTATAGPLKVLSKPPSQPAFFIEGAAPGNSGLLAVRAFGTGSWYWLNAEAGVLNPFPLSLGPDDGPVVISADGTLAAVAMPDRGAVIQPINSALPLASPSAGVTPAGTASPRPSPTLSAPKRVNSKLQHPDGLAWSPDAKQLAIAVGGEIQLYSTSGQAISDRGERDRSRMVGADRGHDLRDGKGRRRSPGHGRRAAERHPAAGPGRHARQPPADEGVRLAVRFDQDLTDRVDHRRHAQRAGQVPASECRCGVPSLGGDGYLGPARRLLSVSGGRDRERLGDGEHLWVGE